MCIVSMVGDYYSEQTFPSTFSSIPTSPEGWTRTEIEILRKDIKHLREQMMELRELLLSAKKYDEALGEPDCEIDEKVELIKRLAEIAEVDMKDVF